MLRHANTGASEFIDQIKFRGHIPALDGLRGIAILLVLMLHFYYEGEGIINAAYPLIGPLVTKLAMSGYYGVPLFFVLSGFLITGILVDSRTNPRFFRSFYMRRFLRIFPLYYATLCFILIILPQFVTFAADGQGVLSRQLWLWTYLINAPWSGGGWAAEGVFQLGHFWSLCVEEHFYILWPLVVYVLPLRSLNRVCLGGIGIGLTLRILHSMPGSPEILGWSTLTKADGLFVGSLLSIWLREPSACQQVGKWFRRVLWISGILVIGEIFVPRRLNGTWWWPFCELNFVVFFGALLVAALCAQGQFLRILKSSVLCSFGKYSYGIYVIHMVCQPVFEKLFAHRTLLSGTIVAPLVGQLVFYALTITTSWLLALVSFHLMEKHFLSLKRHFEYRSTPA